MKQQQQEVWIGVEQLTQDEAYRSLVSQEFSEMPIVEQLAQENAPALQTNRRDFLKYLGFGLGAATVAASCDIPVRRAIPYVVKPDEIVPGVATYYASSYAQGGDYCAILVKTREGRPIKIEGNSLSKVTKGGTSARVQASVLSLYDTSRIQGPYRVKNGAIQMPGKSESGPSWTEIDQEIMGKLKPDSRIRIVANTILSPTTKKALADFKAKFPNAEVVMYDPVSSSAILQANEKCFGQAVIPNYHFDKAQVIAGFEADFLGSWISPVEYAAQYAQNRKVNPMKPTMSRHIQVESHMSLTGSNADNRILVKPSEQGAAILALYNALASIMGQATLNGPSLDATRQAKIKGLAKELAEAKGASLVVSGSNNTAEQVLVNAINDMLGNYGATITFSEASLQRQGNDKAVRNLVADMNAGKVDALFIMDGANPAFDLPDAAKFVAGMKRVALKVSFSGVPNESLLACDYATPNHHFLESWGDAEAKRGHYSLIQPVIAPLFNTRQAEESLLRWAASETLDVNSDQPCFEYLKAHWQQALFPKQSNFSTFQAFWDSTLHDGIFEVSQSETSVSFSGDVSDAASKVRKPSNAELEVAFFETVNMGAGQFANNPWLLEMPDPLTRTVWGNYLTIPVGWDGEKFTSFKNLNDREIYGKADIVEIDVKGRQKQRVTAVRQFGQMQGTVGLALGFGREVTGNVGRALGNKVGVNVYPWLDTDADGNTQYYAINPEISDKVATEEDFACVQYHHTMGVTEKNGKTYKDAVTGKDKQVNLDEKVSSRLKDPFNEDGFQGGITERSVIYKANLKEVPELVEKIKERRGEAAHLNEQTLYPTDQYVKEIYSQGHWWAMHIDLNACTGCGACQVACIAENNVPVVGKKEVSRHHEMTWLRIDRYYYGDYENPNVVYQPMMCQHCDNAPCENVCPVAATNHSSEGLNQMTYNRCIGTRYCANNCPYKVRRFNWLDYTTADIFVSNEDRLNGEEIPFYADNLVRMVLNPDVTVRSRGVIEKCSFCVQRIQEGKLTAKREGRRLGDNDVRSACQTACPTGAITFGDRNNKESMVAQRSDNPLNYLVLEEVNTMSSVQYTARVNNRNESLDA